MATLHIEVTNRCTLSCPACPRTEWTDILKRPIDKNDLDYLLLDKFLDCPDGKQIDTFKLCGDYGDAIYYPQLIEFIKHFRHTKRFIITTNGSRQKKHVWEQLASILDDRDEMVFAIDGLEDTNHLYRRNSDWSSIMMGLDIMRTSKVKLRWQTIVFNFNQEKLDEIKSFAESKDAEFYYIKTHRYGDDALVPSETYISLDHLYKRKYNDISVEIEPKCMNRAKAIVGCDGVLYPCNWMRHPNTLYKSQLWKNRDEWLSQLRLENTTYTDAMKLVDKWSNTVRQNSLTGEYVDVLCKMKCRTGVCDGYT